MLVVQDNEDPLKRYNGAAADQSRVNVTAIRYIVENVHAHQKSFKIHAEPVRPSFLRDRVKQYHPFINAVLNAYGSNRASDGPGRATFTGEEKRKLLTKSPFIFETTLSTDIVNSSHDLHYNKRKRATWRKVDFNDENLFAMFPEYMKHDIMKLNAGPYFCNKARGYISELTKRYQDISFWKV